MFKFMSTLAALACIEVSASHLDNKNGIFDTYSFDQVKFKSRTNCSLDKYPEVSLIFHYPPLSLPPIIATKACQNLTRMSTFIDPNMVGHWRCSVLTNCHPGSIRRHVTPGTFPARRAGWHRECSSLQCRRIERSTRRNGLTSWHWTDLGENQRRKEIW